MSEWKNVRTLRRISTPLSIMPSSRTACEAPQGQTHPQCFLKTIRSRLLTQIPQAPQRRIYRELRRDLHPVPVSASTPFAPADAISISAAARSDRPLCAPSFRLLEHDLRMRFTEDPDRTMPGNNARSSIIAGWPDPSTSGPP